MTKDDAWASDLDDDAEDDAWARQTEGDAWARLNDADDAWARPRGRRQIEDDVGQT